jgi:hypothetical protein
MNAQTSKRSEDNTMQRFIIMKCVQKYLKYLQRKKEYDAKKANVTLSLKKKNDYVLGPFMVKVPKKEKKLKYILELSFTNNIYMKQI